MFSVSRFGALFQAFPKRVFLETVKANKSDHKTSRCRSWDLLLLSVFGQFDQSDSLRSCLAKFNLQHRHHYHLNTRELKRATVSDALGRQDIRPFKAACEALIGQVSRQYRASYRELMMIIDSTCIHTHRTGYEWSSAYATRKGRGLKVHIAIAADDGRLNYANITPMNVNDISDAREHLPLTQGTLYAMDKGYCDYNWWSEIDASGAYFVTRLKKNAAFIVTEEHLVHRSGVESDCTIQLTNKSPGGGRKNAYAYRDLRRIVVPLYEGKESIVLVTNDFNRSADELAAAYKKRWQIETLFRWLKQNLKVKTFFGRSENAVRLQIYCALIAYLLAHISRGVSGQHLTLSEYLFVLKATLFDREKENPNYYKRRKERDAYRQKLQPRLL